MGGGGKGKGSGDDDDYAGASFALGSWTLSFILASLGRLQFRGAAHLVGSASESVPLAYDWLHIKLENDETLRDGAQVRPFVEICLSIRLEGRGNCVPAPGLAAKAPCSHVEWDPPHQQ